MATTAIEAKSLSSITSLAANPPVRPQNVHIDPLVLYIARVPGSRDVFLTPMKPRQKVVTAEDIASSLYYLHVAAPEDEDLLKPKSIPEAEVYEAEVELEPPPLPRRSSPPLPARPPPSQPPSSLPDALRPGAWKPIPHPLPALPPYPLDDGPPPVPRHGHRDAPPAAAVVRKPVMPIRKPVSPERRPIGVERKPLRYEFNHQEEPPALPQRKPVQPQLAELQGEALSPVQTSNYTASVYSVDPDAPARPFLAKRPTMATTMSTETGTPEMTVIRRNPATSEQWNVATIADPPVFDIASNGRRDSGGTNSSRIKKSGQPLYLSITNPGYQKFVPSSEQARTASRTGSTPSLTHSETTMDDSSPDSAVFERRMWLEGSLFEKSHSHRKSLSADNADENYLSARPTFNSTYSSDSFASSSRTGRSEDSRLSLVGDNKRSNTRGYTFISPWDGRCEFASGTMGTSLKCRHLRMKNSLNPASNMPAQVSELRFNLPGGGPMASERRRSPSKTGLKERKRDRFMAKFSDKDSAEHASFYESNDAASQMDLSLGQEFAGGGFSGKQAKLGKLIIEGEGLQMLDLIVSANMALWFRAYEKFQEGLNR